MRVFEHMRARRKFLLHEFQHLSEEGAGVANGRALADAGGEGNGVRAAFYEQPGAQGNALAGATAATGESDQLDGLGDVLESAFVGGDHAKVGGAGAVVLRLHAADDAKFHQDRLAFVWDDGFIIAWNGAIVSGKAIVALGAEK